MEQWVVDGRDLILRRKPTRSLIPLEAEQLGFTLDLTCQPGIKQKQQQEREEGQQKQAPSDHEDVKNRTHEYGDASTSIRINGLRGLLKYRHSPGTVPSTSSKPLPLYAECTVQYAYFTVPPTSSWPLSIHSKKSEESSGISLLTTAELAEIQGIQSLQELHDLLNFVVAPSSRTSSFGKQNNNEQNSVIDAEQKKIAEEAEGIRAGFLTSKNSISSSVFCHQKRNQQILQWVEENVFPSQQDKEEAQDEEGKRGDGLKQGSILNSLSKQACRRNTQNFPALTEPLTFVLGAGTVPQGMEEAVLSMEKNELAAFVLDPCFAFKEFGYRSNSLPKDAKLRRQATTSNQYYPEGERKKSDDELQDGRKEEGGICQKEEEEEKNCVQSQQNSKEEDVWIEFAPIFPDAPILLIMKLLDVEPPLNTIEEKISRAEQLKTQGNQSLMDAMKRIKEAIMMANSSGKGEACSIPESEREKIQLLLHHSMDMYHKAFDKLGSKRWRGPSSFPNHDFFEVEKKLRAGLWHNLGVCWMKRAEVDVPSSATPSLSSMEFPPRAIEYFTSCIGVDRYHVKARYRLAQYHFKRCEFDTAREQLLVFFGGANTWEQFASILQELHYQSTPQNEEEDKEKLKLRKIKLAEHVMMSMAEKQDIVDLLVCIDAEKRRQGIQADRAVKKMFS